MQIRKWAELKFSIDEKTECNQSLKFKFSSLQCFAIQHLKRLKQNQIHFKSINFEVEILQYE